jgi:hypothetical protein
MDNDYKEKAGQIRQLAALPADQLATHFSNLHNTLASAAPRLAPHIYGTATNAIHYLNSKLPNAGNELIQDKQLPPSDAQKNAWLDLHKTVDDPLSVLDHVNKGTIRSSHIDALKSVYPDLHQEMVQKTMEHLGGMKMKGQELPYSKRLAIGKLIGMPLDSTMTQQNMSAIMQAASQNTGPQAQANKSPKRASGVELDQIDKVAKLSQTPDQARQSQKPE